MSSPALEGLGANFASCGSDGRSPNCSQLLIYSVANLGGLLATSAQFHDASAYTLSPLFVGTFAGAAGAVATTVLLQVEDLPVFEVCVVA